MKAFFLILLLFCSTLSFAQIGPAPVNSINTWRVEQVYSIGQAVVRNGVIYQSLVNNNLAYDPAGSPSQWSTTFTGGSGGGSSFGLLNFPGTVSATTPLYLSAHFRDDIQALFLSYSPDATSFIQSGGTYATAGSAGGIRDPGALYANNKFFFAYTAAGGGTFNYITSTDLQTFTAPVTVTVNGAAAGGITWSPRFFTDPVSGNYYTIVTACTSACGSGQLPFIATFDPTTSTFGTWSQVSLTGESGFTGLIDFRLWYSAGTYYMLYAWANGGTEYIHIASASAVTGPYTRIHSGSTDYFGFGTIGENPDIVQLPNGNTRIYADSVTNTGGSLYWANRKWVDTQNSFNTVVGTPAIVGGPEQEGATILTLTTPALATLVYNVAFKNQASYPNQIMGPIGINAAPNAQYSIFVANLGSSAYPNGINPNPYTTLALGNASGLPSVITSYGAGSFGFGSYPSDRLGSIAAGYVDTRGLASSGTAGSNNAQIYAQAFTVNTAAIELDDTSKGGDDWQWVAYNTSDGFLFAQDFTKNTTAFSIRPGTSASYNALLQAGQNGTFCWATSAQYASTSTCDAGISRSAANAIALGNGTQGNATANVSLGSVKPTVYTVATLPSASTLGAGATVMVSDATTFTPGTCTGSGSDYMLAVSNGTTWSCH